MEDMSELTAEEQAKLLRHELEVLKLESEMQDKTREQIDRGQRDYYLREQMKVIRYTMKTALICNCRMLIVWITRMSC